MAELRRLFIQPERLKGMSLADQSLLLTIKETHYLTRVLRLKNGDQIELVDGCGHLWRASLKTRDLLWLESMLENLHEVPPRPRPLLGLAVVVPKRGFPDFIRMSSEIGIDLIQPLFSDRGTFNRESRRERWEGIIHEAVEQSERLWTPKLLDTIKIGEWFKNRSVNSAVAFASTRLKGGKDFHRWLEPLSLDLDEIWVAIGPEGGWTSNECSLAETFGSAEVELGKNILTTSTAGVVDTQTMVSWRRNRYFSL